VCGICGVVDLERKREVDPAMLDAMSTRLQHRGPDSDGKVICGDSALAMRRLAIIDVEGGRQPFVNEDGHVHVVCNGEIYNHLSLRADLSARGHRFKTQSDCEVVVHAYEEYGEDFVRKLNGMFALAVLDTRRRWLLLARDRVGIKPLYYALHSDWFLFASEPKALLAFEGFPRSLDLRSLDQYLAHEYVPTPRSIFDGVSKVRPGHLLTVKLELGEVLERRYWNPDLSASAEFSGASEAELAEWLWQTFRDSVGMELMSDVPLGVFLSGGIDSSAVAAAMTDLNSGTVHSFSIGFEDDSFDESRYARRAAAYLGTQHSELILEPRMLWELVPSVMSFLDEPLADASIIPTHLLSRFARENVTVALGGDGGDEMFAGYPTLQAHRVAAYYRHIPAILRDGVIAPLVRRLPVSLDNMSFDFRAKQFISGASHPPAECHHLWLGAFSPGERTKVLHPEVRAHLNSGDHTPLLDEHVRETAGYDDISRILYLDMKMYLEGDILVKVDRASMGCSLEVRVPVLNAKMLEFATRLPVRQKLRRFTRKFLFRRAMRGRLPDDIIDRPKKGFGIPVSKWLKSELKPLVLDLLSEERLKRQQLFSAPYVEGLIRDHNEGVRDNRKPLWTLLMFQLWYDAYLGQAARGA
jgi:asparagine synthase (glutamine-hydrolysing)